MHLPAVHKLGLDFYYTKHLRMTTKSHIPMTTPTLLARAKDDRERYHGAKNSTYTSALPRVEGNTKAGLLDPTTSSKLEGVSSTTLLAVTPSRRDNMQATKEETYIKESIMI
jgi:hypothetical protein